MTLDPSALDVQFQVACEALERIAADLTMITDRTMAIDTPNVELATQRAAGRGQIHISFKLGFRRGAQLSHGTLIVPLSASIALASWFLMMSDAEVESLRRMSAPDASTKSALLEVGSFVANAFEASLRSLGIEGVRVHSEGCQGVNRDLRPAFPHNDGDDLLVARTNARLADGDPFEIVLMMPPIE
jgi:hypothetical protein